VGGDADPALRERVTFSLRTKLDRTDHYDLIDQFAMKDLTANIEKPIDASTSAAALPKLAGDEKPVILIWGELSDGLLKMNVLDTRRPGATPKEIKLIADKPTDLRFASEHVIEALAEVAPFAHPTEESVQHDATAEEMWETGRNLVPNGAFDQAGAWDMMYLTTKESVKIASALPAPDQVVIYPLKEGDATNNVLVMNLSRACAENQGMACISTEPIPIQPGVRYRLSFRYRSDAPRIHPFVKGYTMGKDLTGQPALREVYRRQVPPANGTEGKWVEVIDEMNPQHITFPVQYLKIDLYAYLSPGTVMWDDVVLKAVGKQNRIAKDDAITPPATRALQRR
jgi:hypothetical protein